MGASIPNTKLKYRNPRCNDKYPKKDRGFFSNLLDILMLKRERQKSSFQEVHSSS